MPNPRTPSPWLALILSAIGAAILLGTNLIGAGRESGSITTELRSVREELSSLRSGMASSVAASAAARVETRADLAAVASDIRSMDKLVVELRATQAGAERRWEEANRSQDERIRLQGEIVTSMRDALVSAGLRMPLLRRQNGGALDRPADLRPVRWMLPLRTDITAP